MQTTMTTPTTPPTTDAAAVTTAAALEGDTLPKRLREAWHKTVGTFATDEKGTQSLLQRLVDFGHLSAEEAKKVLTEAQKKIEENKGELDRRVDASIKSAVERFTENKEVKKLEERIEELEAKLKTLESSGN